MASSGKEPNLGQIATQLLQDSLQNIIHDILITKHREHKMLLSSLDPKTKLPICDRCQLPRLLKPPLAPKVRGAAAEPPKDTQYCDRKPWSRRPGHDIYDNPFPKMDVTGRPPKPNKNNKKDADGTPASNEEINGTAPPSPSADGDTANNAGGTGKEKEKLEKGEKKASKIDEKLKKGEYVPWHTCPTCKRSLLITRFAKHLEQCMGLSGRAASRNALAKMNGANANNNNNNNNNNSSAGNGTPAGSRGGTPNPASADLKSDDRDGDDSDEGRGKGSASGNVRKNLLTKKKKEKEKQLKKEKSTVGAAANGKLPKSTPSKRAGTTAAGDGGKDSTKRERDDADDGDEEDTVHVKKRQKLQRAGSAASLGSMSSAAPFSAIDPDPGESVDGSFVDDASVVDD